MWTSTPSFPSLVHLQYTPFRTLCDSSFRVTPRTSCHNAAHEVLRFLPPYLSPCVCLPLSLCPPLPSAFLQVVINDGQPFPSVEFARCIGFPSTSPDLFLPPPPPPPRTNTRREARDPLNFLFSPSSSAATPFPPDVQALFSRF